MTGRVGAAGRALRVGVGVLGVAVAVGAIGATGLVETPRFGVEAPSVAVEPTPADQLRACAGDALVGVGDTGDEFETIGSAELVSGTGGVDVSGLETSGVDGGDAGGAALAQSDADGVLGGATSQTVDEGSDVGLAAAACVRPQAQSWIVAGSTVVGRSGVLVLSNPGATDASVDLAFAGEEGAVQAPGASGIAVPAGTQRALSLQAYVPDVLLPAVRVTARGSQVAASLQSSSVRALDPAGIDTTTPAAAPAEEQIIPGVVIREDADRAEGEDYDDAVAAVRVYAPGEEDVTVRVAVAKGDEGEQPEQELVLAGGSVAEFGIGQLDEGEYRVRVSADAPVVAAARTTTRDELARDFSWTPAAERLDGPQAVAVPEGDDARLHLANPTDERIDGVLVDEDGDEREVGIEPGAQLSLGVDAGVSRLEADGVHASVTIAGPDAGIAAVAVPAASSGVGVVTVYPR